MRKLRCAWGSAQRRPRWLQNDEGQGLAEYAMILTVVAMGLVDALTSLGTGIAGSAGFSLF